MPISLFPADKRLYWLTCDKDIPLAERPVFECRSPTRKIMLEWSRLKDEAEKIGKGLEAYEKLRQMIELGVEGWRNFPEPYSIEALEKILTNSEYCSLAFEWPAAFELGEEERRGFPSPQNSDAENSAANAPVDATTPPQNNPPS